MKNQSRRQYLKFSASLVMFCLAGSRVLSQDLYGIAQYNTGSGHVEVHSVSTSSNFQTFTTHVATPRLATAPSEYWFYAMADFDGDGSLDLVGVVANSNNSFDVHILSGASGFQQSLLDTNTPLTGSAGSFTFAVVDTDHDGKPDLVGIKSYAGQGSVEIHTLSGGSNFQNFTAHVATPLPSTPSGSGRFYTMADVDLDGNPDLVTAIYNGGSSHMDVHVLSAASNYQ